jgi:5-methylcytosine-specific restriction endonuclease McrA
MHSGNYIDSVGKTYNYLTVIEEFKGSKVKIRCVCGVEKIRDKYSVTGGRLKSCGCKTINIRREKIIKDTIGRKFGRWTVIAFDSIHNKRTYKWKCQCDCGKIKVIGNLALIMGESKSCGCIRKEIPFLKYSGETSFNCLYYNYKRNATKRAITFCLSKDNFKLTTSSNCFYCGDKPYQIMSKSHSKKRSVIDYSSYVYNGVDRVDSNLGYHMDNIVACCWKCNIAKNDMSVEEFRSQIKKIVAYKKMDKYFNISMIDIDSKLFVRSGIKSAMSAYRRHAVNRAISFELSLLQFYALSKSICFYCGEEPSNLCRRYTYNGIDRLDSKLGYTMNNVVPCCKRCNISKASMSVEEFKSHVYKIYLNWASK